MAEQVLEGLIKDYLLVETTPGTDSAVDFARRHRLMPLMLGLGNTSEEPRLYSVGMVGMPVVSMSSMAYDLYEWAHMDARASRLENTKLPDEGHVDIWALAHGLPNRTDTIRWTRRAIIEAADDADMPDAASILDSLAGLGLIVEVTRGTEQAREFAESYRLQSLLIGLGNSPEDPVLDGIGLVGIPPVVKVRPRVFEIWQWAHLWPTVWAAWRPTPFLPDAP